MTESRDEPRRLERFEDIAGLSDELLRQIGARVHIMDLAYAFGAGDPALLERLLKVVRPGLAADIRSGVQMMNAEKERFPLEDQLRASRARVMDIARGMLEEGEAKRE